MVQKVIKNLGKTEEAVILEAIAEGLDYKVLLLRAIHQMSEKGYALEQLKQF